MTMRILLVAGALVPLAAARGQSNPRDTARSLDAVVVTAERTRTPLSGSIAAVTRLSRADLASTPRATLADLLRRAPGFAVIDFDGLGFDPQVMVRGFYGGGEAEYVAVLVDGRPVSQLQTGLVAWEVLPPVAAIEAIEIVRGSASPLYGDAAVAGVINVITRARASGQRIEVGGGSFGGGRVSFDGSLPSSRFTVGGGFDRTSGFRAHSARSSTRARLSYALVEERDARLELTALGHWRSFDEPGPLLESLMAADRKASDPIFRFDHTSDESQALTLSGDRRIGRLARLSGSVGGERRQTDAVRTLALAPDFGDTKLRKSSVLRAAGDFQIDIANTALPGTESIVLGGGISHGTLDSRYHDVAAGPGAAYGAASGEPGPETARGDATRSIGSLHAQYTLLATTALRLSAGGRFDALRDAFRPSMPASVEDADATHTAFSPRLGANLRYMDSPRNSGNAYVTVSRSFKAPTLDQLYDLRAIPIPFDPFEIRTSNPDLEPQTGTNVEAGLYQSVAIGQAVRVGASLSAYEMKMKNELDFDVASFRYVNIGRSRHRGLEAGANVDAGRSSLFASYALQDVVSRSGDNEGKRLKAIPRHTLTAGGTANVTHALSLSLLVANLRGMFIDDANTASIPAYTRADAGVTLAVRGVEVFADARNLLAAKYSSSGFLDPAGSGQAYYYPAAGRVVQVGLRWGN